MLGTSIIPRPSSGAASSFVIPLDDLGVVGLKEAVVEVSLGRPHWSASGSNVASKLGVTARVYLKGSECSRFRQVYCAPNWTRRQFREELRMTVVQTLRDYTVAVVSNRLQRELTWLAYYVTEHPEYLSAVHVMVRYARNTSIILQAPWASWGEIRNTFEWLVAAREVLDLPPLEEDWCHDLLSVRQQRSGLDQESWSVYYRDTPVPGYTNFGDAFQAEDSLTYLAQNPAILLSELANA